MTSTMMASRKPYSSTQKEEATNSKDEAAAAGRRRRGGTGLNDFFIAIFGVGFLLSLSLNFLHSTDSIPHSHNTAIHNNLKDFKTHGVKLSKSKMKIKAALKNDQVVKEEEEEEEEQQQDHGGDHPLEIHQGDPVLHELNCDKYGGPAAEFAQEMVYWSDIPSDADYISPFHLGGTKGETKYMTFEPDGGYVPF
jgi:hypothetical protein